MATGDLKNNLRKLQFHLRTIKYDHEVDIESLGRGVPLAFLPIYHFAFVEYSRSLSKQILEMHFEMYSKTDLRFIEIMYKVLRELFLYKPAITKEQFFSPGFAERKVIMCCDILQLVQDMDKKLTGFKPVKNSNMRISSQNKFLARKLSKPSSPSEADAKCSLASSEQDFPVLPNLCHGTENGNTTRVSTLVPIVINEASVLAACDSKSSVSGINAANLHEQITAQPTTVDCAYVTELPEDEYDDRIIIDNSIHNRLMTLNETRLNSHQTIINNVCEKLSSIASTITKFEERLNRMDALLMRLTSDNDSSTVESSVPESYQLKHSLENVIARLTLVENRVSFVESQSKSLNPCLENLSSKTTNGLSKLSMDREMPSTKDSRSIIANSFISTPSTFNNQEESFVALQSSESVNKLTVQQTKRIEAMLWDTDELLTKNLQQTGTRVSEFISS